MNWNKTQIGGYLCRDWELRYTPKGMAIASNSIAVNRTWKTETGEQKEEVNFIPLTAFGRSAENLSQYTKKGHPLFIEGRLKFEQWDDKQTGQKRSALKVIVESFQFLNKREGGGDGGQQGGQYGSNRRGEEPQHHPANTPDSEPPLPEDDDIPF